MSTDQQRSAKQPDPVPAWLSEMQRVIEAEPASPPKPTKAEGPDRGRK